MKEREALRELARSKGNPHTDQTDYQLLEDLTRGELSPEGREVLERRGRASVEWRQALEAHRPVTPSELDAAVARLLSGAQQRPSGPQPVAFDGLGEVREGGPSLPTPPEARPQAPQRGWGPLRGFAAAAVVLVVGAVGAVYSLKREPLPRYVEASFERTPTCAGPEPLRGECGVWVLRPERAAGGAREVRVLRRSTSPRDAPRIVAPERVETLPSGVVQVALKEEDAGGDGELIFIVGLPGRLPSDAEGLSASEAGGPTGRDWTVVRATLEPGPGP